MDAIKLLIIPGEGIGPEITAAAIDVLKVLPSVVNLALDLEFEMVGMQTWERHGTTIPEHVIDKAKAAEGLVLGPLSHNDYPPVSEGGLNPSGVLRKQLDLYANLRPARTRAGIPTPLGKAFDLLIVRENTEGFYADRSMYQGIGAFMPTEDLALSVRKISRKGSRRILQKAFEAAQSRRKKVTVVHKANVLRITGGLFLEESRKLAKEYPYITYEEQLIDSMTALLIRQPDAYDVIVTTNMFGDILSDEASELSGGLGLGSALNAGDQFAMAQAQHGSAPDIAGMGKANPTSLIGSVAMLLRWIGDQKGVPPLHEAGDCIDRALDECLSRPETRTPDLGGPLTTKAFGNLVAEKIVSQNS